MNLKSQDTMTKKPLHHLPKYSSSSLFSLLRSPTQPCTTLKAHPTPLHITQVPPAHTHRCAHRASCKFASPQDTIRQAHKASRTLIDVAGDVIGAGTVRTRYSLFAKEVG